MKKKKKQLRAEVYTSMIFTGFPFDSQVKTFEQHCGTSGSEEGESEIARSK